MTDFEFEHDDTDVKQRIHELLVNHFGHDCKFNLKVTRKEEGPEVKKKMAIVNPKEIASYIKSHAHWLNLLSRLSKYRLGLHSRLSNSELWNVNSWIEWSNIEDSLGPDEECEVIEGFIEESIGYLEELQDIVIDHLRYMKQIRLKQL